MSELDPSSNPESQSRIGTLIERAGEVIGGLKDSIDRKAAILLIGGVGLVGGGVAAANQLDAESALAAETPATEASTDTLKQRCIDAGLIMPKVTQAVMKNPGSRRGRTQDLLIRVQQDVEFPPECDPFNRRTQFKSQIKRDGRWRTMSYDWTTLYEDESAGWGIFVESPSPHNPDWHFNNCNDKAPVRARIRNVVEKDELILKPVKGSPGLFDEVYPLLGQKVITKRVAVRC